MNQQELDEIKQNWASDYPVNEAKTILKLVAEIEELNEALASALKRKTEAQDELTSRWEDFGQATYDRDKAEENARRWAEKLVLEQEKVEKLVPIAELMFLEMTTMGPGGTCDWNALEEQKRTALRAYYGDKL